MNKTLTAILIAALVILVIGAVVSESPSSEDSAQAQVEFEVNGEQPQNTETTGEVTFEVVNGDETNE